MSGRILALVGCAVLACLTGSAPGQPGDGKKDEKAGTPPAVDQRGPSIKDVYKGYWLIGMAGDLPGNYSDEELALVKGNFSIVTPENCMKPAPVHPSEDTWRFGRPDALVKWCSDNHLAVHGHTLVWHAQTGSWFFRDGDKAAVTRRLKDHIRTLVGRYKGKIRSWDVVNEAISDGGDAQTARTENLRNSSWLRALGPEFIALAFRFAHEADPDAELYYNDYGIEFGPKHESSMVLLKRLIKDGVPIHGVGIQGHWRTGTVPYADVDRAVADYASLGLKVSISELDVTIRGASGGQFGPGPGFGGRRGGGGPPPSPQDLKAQADAYARLFAIFLKHKGVVERVTFWGLSDRRTWRFGQHPLLFDSKNQRKPAYTAIVNVLLHPNPDLTAPRPPATQPAGEAGAGAPTTYCNPISLPNYPLGRRARDVTVGAPVLPDDPLWLVDKQQQFRELADVSVLWHEGTWYMYPSVDMAWVSRDGGATWQHHPLNVRDVGYAPTVVKHKGKFLLMASESSVYTADSPLGPFREIGPIRLPGGLPSQIDPMLFSDDDGRLFYYWGCTPAEGIFGVELDADNPSRVIGKPAKMIAFEPDKFPWQRLGDWNEQPARGWVEGAWMFKRNGKYYLTYSAAGTENRTYAMGCAVSQSPLGPFVPQKNNPILRSTTGLITGTGHGCVVEGPYHSLWAFYTVRAGVVHGFERRLGMDPASIGEDGELHVSGASSLPRRLPAASKGAGPTGWLPLNAGPRTVGSSDAPNLSGRLAVDDDLRTWWQPAADDKAPTLTSNLTTPNAVVRAVRVIWRDVGLNTKRGAEAGAFRYKVEVQTAADTWATVIDRSQSKEDLLIDYRECPATPGMAARLIIVGAPPGITPGVAEFTVFGEVRQQGRMTNGGPDLHTRTGQ